MAGFKLFRCSFKNMQDIPISLIDESFTGKNTVISTDFLVWKFCGKAQFPHSFGPFVRNYAETVPFRKIFTPWNQVKLRYCSQCLYFLHTTNYKQETIYYVQETKIISEKFFTLMLKENRNLQWFFQRPITFSKITIKILELGA